MQRRVFIAIVGGAAAAWPLTARGQPARKLPRIGYLSDQRQRTLRQAGLRLRRDGRRLSLSRRWAANLSLHQRRGWQDTAALLDHACRGCAL